MELDLFSNNLIGELKAYSSSLLIKKIGDAKYRFTILSDGLLEFVMWTSKLGVIEFLLSEINNPGWVEISSNERTLIELRVKHCDVHIEHCDRGVYWLGLNKGEEAISVCITTRGYLKTRIVEFTR